MKKLERKDLKSISGGLEPVKNCNFDTDCPDYDLVINGTSVHMTGTCRPSTCTCVWSGAY